MNEFKDNIDFVITKENAKEFYIKLNGEFSPYLREMQFDSGDFYEAPKKDHKSIDDNEFINNIFDGYYSFIDFESNLMEKYRNSDSKYNILGKFRRLGFTDDDFLKWNIDILNERIDKYYQEKKEICIEKIPYCSEFYDSKFTTLLNAFDVYTTDYESNKRLLEAIYDCINLNDGMIYKYYNYWCHNGRPNKDDIHPFYALDEALINNATISEFFEFDFKANPLYMSYYHEHVDNHNLKYRFAHLGYSDLLEMFNNILKLRKEYIGNITYNYCFEAKDLLDIYKEIFKEKSILCPYYDSKSHEMEEMLDISNKLRNYFIYFDDKIIGTITYTNEFYNKYSYERDTCIKCIGLIPEYQNKGIGKKTMDYIFNSFINSKNIYIDIPKYNNRLVHFFVDICKMEIVKEYTNDQITICTLVKNRK